MAEKTLDPDFNLVFAIVSSGYDGKMNRTSVPDSPGVEITFAHPSPTPRWVIVVLELFLGALVGYVVVGIATIELSPTRPPPSLPPVVGAVVCAVLALLIPLPRHWTVVRIGHGSIRLKRDRGHSQELHSRDIQLIAGEAGISLDGGNLIVWKRVRIATATESHVIVLDPKGNKSCYQQLLLVCPGALGLSYSGEVHLPEVPEGSKGVEWITSVSKVAAREFGWQTRQAFGVAGLMALATAGLLTLVILAANSGKPGENVEDAGSFVVQLVVLGVVTIGLGWRAVKQYFRGRRVMQAIRRLDRAHMGQDRS